MRKSSDTTTTIYTGANVFTGDANRPFADAFAVTGDRILACGPEEAVRRVAGAHATEVDLGGSFVTPGIIEAHAHLGMLGEAVDKVQLRDCRSLAEIQERLVERRAAQPDAPLVLGVSWMFDALDAPRPTAAMIDAVVSDVPVLLDANDLHSVWVNSAALTAMGITDDTPNPIGGEIVRDEHGHATGFLLETAAMEFAWSYLASVTTDADHDRFFENACAVYLESGVTGATDMALNDDHLGAIVRRLERDGSLPFPITGHWFLSSTGDSSADLAQVTRAIELRDDISARFGDAWFRIAGVKLVLDGVIDACTAAMRSPYANGEDAGPIWTFEAARPVVLAADAAGMQLALHAIGDAASELAASLVECCVTDNGPNPTRMPRIEHLESVGTDTISRMAALGIIASMQPVHCDPAIMANWMSMLGDSRSETGFPWHLFREAGVTLALGTDAPTAPHVAQHNLFIALTARSALDPSLPPYHPERSFSPADALEAMTLGAARAAGLSPEVGRIAPGYRANVAVFDVDPFTAPADDLLRARTLRVLVDGEVAYLAHKG